MAILDNEVDERAVSKAALEAAEKNLRTLCAEHAPTFVAVERRGALLTSALTDLIHTIDDASPKVQESKKCMELEASNEEKSPLSSAASLKLLAERHRVRRRTLMQHSALLELLELPSLMDACVRSNLYEDALSVAAFANSLERKHLQDTSSSPHKVVANVVSEVRLREADLRRHLLQRLRSEMTMPQCLEVVTALRRLNGVELERKTSSAKEDLESIHAAMELSLVVDFFEARDLWLDSPSNSSAQLNMANIGPSEQLLDLIERYRTRCFEIATQFLAIFRTSTQISNQETSLSLLSLWTTRRIQIFLKALTKQLTLIDDCAALRDALDATLFFSTSMGRIGADFQALLPPIFEPRLVHIIDSHWQEGIVTLEKTLKICRDAGVASPLYEQASQDNAEETINKDASSTSQPVTPAPPRILLSFPPLARIVNAYLTGLNELRRCLLPGAFIALQEQSDKCCDHIKDILQTNERTVLTPGMKGEAAKLREVAANMKKIFDDVVIPYFKMTLDIALGLYVDPPPPPVEKIEEKGDDLVEEVQDIEKIEEEVQDETVTVAKKPVKNEEICSE